MLAFRDSFLEFGLKSLNSDHLNLMSCVFLVADLSVMYIIIYIFKYCLCLLKGGFNVR